MNGGKFNFKQLADLEPLSPTIPPSNRQQCHDVKDRHLVTCNLTSVSYTRSRQRRRHNEDTRLTIFMDIDETMLQVVQPENATVPPQFQQLILEYDNGSAKRAVLRPDLCRLLFQLSARYRVGVFTMGTQAHAVASILAINHYCKLSVGSSKIFTDASLIWSRESAFRGAKDLYFIGQDLKRSIIVDNSAKSFARDAVKYNNQMYATNGLKVSDMTLTGLQVGYSKTYKRENGDILRQLEHM